MLQQYVQTDPTAPAVPLSPEDFLFLSENPEQQAKEKIGFVGSVFRALGLVWDEDKEAAQHVPESKKVARRKRTGGLFER